VDIRGADIVILPGHILPDPTDLPTPISFQRRSFQLNLIPRHMPTLRDQLLDQLYQGTSNVINEIVAQLEILSESQSPPFSSPGETTDDIDAENRRQHRNTLIAHLRDFISSAVDFEETILNTRVLNNLPTMPDEFKQNLAGLWWCKDNREDDFRRYVRVKPATFDTLVDYLKDNPEFHNNSNNPQTDIRIQLAVVLYRLGHYGNSASVADIADWAGVSEGSVVMFTRWVLLALLDLHDTAFPKLSPEMIEKSKEWARRVCDAWANGFMAADGTNLNLFMKPGHYGQSYFDKSSKYSMNLQVSS
jgi:hypothetical protein